MLMLLTKLKISSLPTVSCRGEVKREVLVTSLGSSDGSGSTCHQWKFKLDIRKHSFTKMVVKTCNRIATEVTSLSEFKRPLDNALNSTFNFWSALN